MKGTEKRVFISYRHSDGDVIAKNLKRVFEQSAYHAFLDDIDLRAGLWSDELQDAIKQSCSLIAPCRSFCVQSDLALEP